MVRVAVAADDTGPLVDAVVAWLGNAGHDVLTPGEPIVWPAAGRWVGERVTDGSAALGVVMCWTGTGVSIAANKVVGVRAALCADAETAAGARRWNDANVLALSMRLTTPTVGEEILGAFFGTSVDAAERPVIGDVEPGAAGFTEAAGADLAPDVPGESRDHVVYRFDRPS